MTDVLRIAPGISLPLDFVTSTCPARKLLAALLPHRAKGLTAVELADATSYPEG